MMRLIPIIVIVLSIQSCNSEPKINRQSIPVIVPVQKSYGFVIIETSEPRLDMYSNTVSRQNMRYCSYVLEISERSEDEKYRLIDEYERTVRNQMDINDKSLEIKLGYYNEVSEENKHSKILRRDCKIFDSYKLASLSRRGYSQ